MAETKQRTIEALAADFLTLAEVAKALTVEVTTLKRMIGDGEFPRPLRISRGTRLWTWKDLFIYFGWLELQDRMRPTQRKPEVQSGAIEGKQVQSGPIGKRSH